LTGVFAISEMSLTSVVLKAGKQKIIIDFAKIQ